MHLMEYIIKGGIIMFCRRRNYRTISQGDILVNELKNKIKQGAILVDVRSKQEYSEGHIQNAINIPEHEIDNLVEKIIPNKDQLIVVYCSSGNRSRKAYIKMKQKGYSQVYNLYGGLEMM